MAFRLSRNYVAKYKDQISSIYFHQKLAWQPVTHGIRDRNFKLACAFGEVSWPSDTKTCAGFNSTICDSTKMIKERFIDSSINSLQNSYGYCFSSLSRRRQDSETEKGRMVKKNGWGEVVKQAAMIVPDRNSTDFKSPLSPLNPPMKMSSTTAKE